MFGQKRIPSREGGVEIVVEELCTRMVCIIFKKQFLFFVQKGSGAAENDRFYSLMSMLHLEDRMVTSGDAACISEKMKKPIDYEKVYEVIHSERIRTDRFFEKYGI